MKKSAYQIKLELAGSKPKIWRKLIIPADILLSDLHKVIQTAMGWTNSHLHQFIKGRVFLEPPIDDDFLDSAGIDYTGYTIDRLLEEKSDKIRYEYDFGDGWEHIITLEEIIENCEEPLPVCTDGAMNCPPEDVGGIWGFQEFKKALNNPSHPEHEMYKEWIGGQYDPEYFDLDEVNEMLQDDNFGVFEW
ncbi:plasmid pRiA4b ORF-3 family protein [Rhodohalobacter sp.]|uniref:plasmid pRiA4b ORF-3 family protein n=1 Tax=Rhodohalobacter sp. TaxID=1974210 RepID=UPI002ACD83A4|nr:plasmid pRiA4b ORF-3 family protein [Rhodohalobacter sp.]MDZ7757973.1 plasmid pRiA4b ORF-3 family protein [Rhodohalobacter sp.]